MHVSRETFANRGNGDKLVYRHFRGAASCDCFLIALHSGAIANTHRASAVKIHLYIFIAEPQDVAIASLLLSFLVQSPTRTRAYNMLVSRSHSSEPQDVAIVSLLPYFLVQSPTRSSISELPDVIPADAGIARRVKKLTPAQGRGDILLNHSP